jgi:hypothetical protein
VLSQPTDQHPCADRIGQELIGLLRAVGNLPPEQQQDALAQLKAERERKAAKMQARRRKKQRTTEKPAGENHAGTANGHYDVIDEPDDSAGSTTSDEQLDGHPTADEAVPEPRDSEEAGVEEAAGERQPPNFLERFRLLAAMAHELDPAQFDKAVRPYTGESMSEAR